LFDVYRPKAAPADAGLAAATQRSLAVRLTLGASDATLTDDQIEQAVKAVLNQLAQDLDAHQRV